MGSDSTKPGTISADKLCELTGLSDRRHRQLAKDGYFPPPLRGQYQANATIAGLFKHFQELLHKKNDSLAVIEERLKTAKAEMAEEELAAFRKRYVLKEEIGPALRNVSLHMRATLQLKFENEVAPSLAGLKPLEIRTRIQTAVDAVCLIFEKGIRSWMDAEPAAAAAVPGPKPDKKGKGKP